MEGRDHDTADFGAIARRMFGLVEPIGLIPYATDERPRR